MGLVRVYWACRGGYGLSGLRVEGLRFRCSESTGIWLHKVRNLGSARYRCATGPDVMGLRSTVAKLHNSLKQPRRSAADSKYKLHVAQANAHFQVSIFKPHRTVVSSKWYFGNLGRTQEDMVKLGEMLWDIRDMSVSLGIVNRLSRS